MVELLQESGITSALISLILNTLLCSTQLLYRLCSNCNDLLLWRNFRSLGIILKLKAGSFLLKKLSQPQTKRAAQTEVLWIWWLTHSFLRHLVALYPLSFTWFSGLRKRVLCTTSKSINQLIVLKVHDVQKKTIKFKLSIFKLYIL